MENLFLFYLFIYLFALDTHNLDHMYPYQLLVAVAKKKGKLLGGKRETIVAIITEFLIKSLSIHVVSGFHVQSIQIAVYLLQQH